MPVKIAAVFPNGDSAKAVTASTNFVNAFVPAKTAGANKLPTAFESSSV